MFDKRTLRELLNNGTELNSDECRRFRNLWKQTPASQRVEIIGSTIDQITKYLVQECALQKEELRLSKLLSLNISLNEAMELQLTNYLSFISHLMRINGLNARGLLNVMTDFIKNIEEQIFEEIDEQIVVYRNLEQEEQEESDTEREKPFEQEKNYKYDELTWVEGTKIVTTENQTPKQHDSRGNFSRTIKN